MRLPIATWDVTWQRLLATLALVTVLVAALGWFARAIGLPAGYARAQSLGAYELIERNDWAELRRGATRDIALFIPAYVVLAAAVTGLAVASTAARLSIGGAVAGGAVADLVETLLFRRSLTRLLAGGDLEDIERLTQVTQVATMLKFAGLLTALALLLAAAWRGT